MIEVKFTLLDKADADNDGQKLIAKEERYKVKHSYTKQFRVLRLVGRNAGIVPNYCLNFCFSVL